MDLILSPINDNLSFSYGLITHPILPLSHNMEVGFIFKRIKIIILVLLSLALPDSKKIDLNSASYDELKTLPISEEKITNKQIFRI